MRDVRMVQRREHLRFTAEPSNALGIVRDRGQEDLDRDVAIQLRVARAVDLAHSARANRRKDFVGTKASAGGKGQALIVMPANAAVAGKRGEVSRTS